MEATKNPCVNNWDKSALGFISLNDYATKNKKSELDIVFGAGGIASKRN